MGEWASGEAERVPDHVGDGNASVTGGTLTLTLSQREWGSEGRQREEGEGRGESSGSPIASGTGAWRWRGEGLAGGEHGGEHEADGAEQHCQRDPL